MFFEKIIRPALYQIAQGDAEKVHERTLRLLKKVNNQQRFLAALQRIYGCADPVTLWGLEFANPIGLAAGMDKDGQALNVWPALGFGFVEVGTVTALAQPGNPRPRLFSLPASEAIINRMGFNNAGAPALAQRLANESKPSVPLGISIGKSKAVALGDAVLDYQTSLQSLYPYGDYFAINISSPNTPGLRSLQDKKALTELLVALQHTSRATAASLARPPVPLLVKVSPDLSHQALSDVLELCFTHEIAGLIATNTTTTREGLAVQDHQRASETGGLSGRPLHSRACERVAFIHQETHGKLPIIGVGGIHTAEDAQRMLDAGATLLQIYTAFALHGPQLLRRLHRNRRPAR